MKILWKNPLTARGFGPRLIQRPGRLYEIQWDSVNEDDHIFDFCIECVDVHALSITHNYAMSAAQIESAYERLIELDDDTLFARERQRMREIVNRTGQQVSLRHFRYCFDDGPCYDLLCENVIVKEGPPRTLSPPRVE